MGSSYFGEPNWGSERASGFSSSSTSSPSSSSRKGKKNNSEKPKQPQRGLGVAQLEKIRLHGQIDCGYPPTPLHPPPYPSTFSSETAYSSIPSSSFSYSSSSSSYSASYGFQPNIAMGVPEYERTNIRYGNSQPTNTARWDNANIFQTQSSAQPNITRPFLNLYDSQDLDTRKHRSGSLGSNSQNSESSDTQEPDLELRLSL